MSNNLKRKIKRKKLKQAEKELATKVSLFGLLGDQCLVCAKPFDKKNKEQVMSWSVVVKNEKNEVNLYCPDCWSKAAEIVNDFKKRVEERNDH
jgi:hypothetical protein